MARPPLIAAPAMHHRQRGYSLAEMLVVVAIIGIASLVAVPSFTAYYRSSKLRTSMRTVTNDMRAARQRAVAKNIFVKLSFKTGTTPGEFRVMESTSGGSVTAVNWVPVSAVKRLEVPCSFQNGNFIDVADKDGVKDGYFDVIFQSDGTAVLPTGVTTGGLRVNSTDRIPIKTYRIHVATAGKVWALAN